MGAIRSMTSRNLDRDFGTMRAPSKVDAWEVDRAPASKTRVDAAVGNGLVAYKDAVQLQLFAHAARCVTYIWVIDADGSVHMSVEELAELPDGTEIMGYPRRRDYPRHPAEEKKLGHPTLVGGNNARVGGELFLDVKGGKLMWFVNVNSGRYCQFAPPSPEQVANVLETFQELVEPEVELDDVVAR